MPDQAERLAEAITGVAIADALLEVAERGAEVAANAVKAALAAEPSLLPSPSQPDSPVDVATSASVLDAAAAKAVVQYKLEASWFFQKSEESISISRQLASEMLEKAEAAYTRAIAADPQNLGTNAEVVYANRALVCLRLATSGGVWTAPAKFEQCITDCDTALRLRPQYVKALYRRARAQLALASKPHASDDTNARSEMLAKALSDFDAVLQLEPNNREARKWRKAAPRLSEEFDGRRLPETLAELAREIGRLDGTLAAKKPTLSPAAPLRKTNAERQSELVLQIGLALVGGFFVVYALRGLYSLARPDEDASLDPAAAAAAPAPRRTHPAVGPAIAAVGSVSRAAASQLASVSRGALPSLGRFGGRAVNATRSVGLKASAGVKQMQHLSIRAGDTIKRSTGAVAGNAAVLTGRAVLAAGAQLHILSRLTAAWAVAVGGALKTSANAAGIQLRTLSNTTAVSARQLGGNIKRTADGAAGTVMKTASTGVLATGAQLQTLSIKTVAGVKTVGTELNGTGTHVKRFVAVQTTVGTSRARAWIDAARGGAPPKIEPEPTPTSLLGGLFGFGS